MNGLRIAMALSAAGPFAILAWTYWHVRQNWAKMADRYPTHWGFNGADAWASSTPENVVGTLTFGAGLCLFVAVVSWLSFRMAGRKMELNHIAPALGAGYVCAIAVSLSPLSGLYDIRAERILLPLVGVLLALSVGIPLVTRSKADRPGWIGGLVYYNPNDPSLWVQRLFGVGWTVNFARPAAWVIVASILALPFVVRLL